MLSLELVLLPPSRQGNQVMQLNVWCEKISERCVGITTAEIDLTGYLQKKRHFLELTSQL